MKAHEFEIIEELYDEQNPKRIYLKNAIKAENVFIGDFTFYDLANDTFEDYEQNHILYNTKGHGELHIGKFCSIANGVQFIMAAANHSIDSFSSYPFCTISRNWAAMNGMTKEDMPVKGDTIIGNDVWIGRDAKIMPGVTIGDGAIIGAYSVVAKVVEPYTIVGGNPAKVIRKRFSDEDITFLKELKWWNFTDEQLVKAIPYITTLDTKNAKIELMNIKLNK
ncbi:CatB-related O-acetyltransferase [Breznakia pachnodae]|uniref:Virginiamycin A acetyltransferase n=1 Tax=Breznakia pachnodae TaxID=265178 RepID=A0ABU0E864_9FIRM|nr:CatB-related O-acetyltransferase [Breznakia pachnodae]MDQ0363087.1 virginiamycin A acetyltransferase [Breznakia pachnodae]